MFNYPSLRVIIHIPDCYIGGLASEKKEEMSDVLCVADEFRRCQYNNVISWSSTRNDIMIHLVSVNNQTGLKLPCDIYKLVGDTIYTRNIGIWLRRQRK